MPVPVLRRSFQIFFVLVSCLSYILAQIRPVHPGLTNIRIYVKIKFDVLIKKGVYDKYFDMSFGSYAGTV